MDKALKHFFLLTILFFCSVSLFAENRAEFGTDWSFSWAFKDEEIEFTMTAPTTGWMALGFNPTRRMKDADYILAFVENGQVYLSDEFGTGLTTHRSDVTLGGEDSARAISFLEEKNRTTITFSLARDSKDLYDATFVPGEKCTVIAAYATSKNLSTKHRKRDSVDIIL
ncbi:DOMON domain-containing protein [Sphaerochaeta sp. PS]|uniref:DOMON domain-containing protein n=1 Tax=Sphaerochaeta sp. PS TaxID=3076336 RepID=UPI0028A566A6|nr:DOMON domain-containing protein [Sphaerochaeta sp. PS]MDT4762120.1 DOMON domain-containing protein [Sphaerochaeta sp. PS]